MDHQIFMVILLFVPSTRSNVAAPVTFLVTNVYLLPLSLVPLRTSSLYMRIEMCQGATSAGYISVTFL